MDKERVIECSGQYENFVEDMNKIQKQEKIINNILSMLPDSSQILEINDLNRVLETEKSNFKVNFQVL